MKFNSETWKMQKYYNNPGRGRRSCRRKSDQ